MPSTDKTLETYGKVIKGKIKFKALLRPLSSALTPNDFFLINQKLPLINQNKLHSN